MNAGGYESQGLFNVSRYSSYKYLDYKINNIF